MELAKQGDPHAIAALINRSLTSKGILAEAALEAECLTISLQASQIPNQKAVITIIHRGMMILQVEQIKRVKILTYRADNNYLAWQYEINLNNNLDNLEPSLPTAQIAKSADLEQDRGMNLVNNPKGVILVQKLSQIQQNLQEYQDVIVRFTDEQVGTVRCLTTLTELIQVISRPSFLFAAVASNPNLRSLLDTIAESSQTDEHGDQVITNLSILQPGQQWQKAKIRLVSKIFLEPAQEDQANPESPHQGLTLDLAETTPESIAKLIVDSDLPSVEISQEDQDNLVTEDEISENSWLDNRSSLPIEHPIEPTLTNPPVINDEIESLESITADSLFDDFPSSSSPELPVIQIVNDVSAISNTSDSLFDEFMDIGSASTYSEAINFNEEIENLSVQPTIDRIDQGDDETEPIKETEDLFGDFVFERRSPKNKALDISTTKLESEIETIKSKIQKQNLDKLLLLMDEQEQEKTESQLVKDKDGNQGITPQLESNLDPNTIEHILGNMQTITLSGSESKSSPNLMTLEDFSEDLNSVGF
jgi:hypothetical protein